VDFAIVKGLQQTKGVVKSTVSLSRLNPKCSKNGSVKPGLEHREPNRTLLILQQEQMPGKPFLDFYSVLKKAKEFPEPLYSLVSTVVSMSSLAIFKQHKSAVFLKHSKRSANAYSIPRLAIPTSSSPHPTHSSLCLGVASAPSSLTSTPLYFRKATRNFSMLPSAQPRAKKAIKK
jgi:hypothetical protein